MLSFLWIGQQIPWAICAVFLEYDQDSLKEKRGMSFVVEHTPSRHSVVWTLRRSCVYKYSRSSVINSRCASSASRQSFEEDQCRFNKNGLLSPRICGWCGEAKICIQQELMHGSWSVRRSSPPWGLWEAVQWLLLVWLKYWLKSMFTWQILWLWSHTSKSNPTPTFGNLPCSNLE